MLIDEYKRSLKMPEAEELFDLGFYRPIAFLFVKAVYRSPITPNQVTFLSMVAGLVAAWFFSIGSAAVLSWAALFYAVANILDCSDGQLARLQKSGTLMGRVVDGVADYISSVAIFLSLGIGFARNADPQWLLVIGAGLSSALHAFFFDHYQSEFMSIVRSERNFLEKEIEQFTREIHRLENEKVGTLKILVLRIYLRYLNYQKRANTKDERQSFDPVNYRKENRIMIRLWSFLGPTTNRTLLIACALAGRIDLFLWSVFIFGNCWLLVCYLLQRNIHLRLQSVS